MKLLEAKSILEKAGYEVEERIVLKNGKELPSLSIGSGKVRPTIYESTIENAKTDTALFTFVDNALNRVPEIDISEITSIEYIYQNATSCIRHMTDDDSIVKFPVFDDLEEYIRIIVDNSENETMSIILTQEMAKTLELDINALRERARDNLRQKSTIKSMEEVLFGLADPEVLDLMPSVPSMWIASVDSKQNGASVILLEDVLTDFCREHGISKLCIIPSSIHECILIKAEADEGYINDMISQVNDTEVAENEVLSNHCYFFEVA